MTERKLISALTEVCEELKSEKSGFCWLTHIGHWRSPTVIAVFSSELQLSTALANEWDIDFINRVNIALDSIKATADTFRFTSEEACKVKSGGNWDNHLSSLTMH